MWKRLAERLRFQKASNPTPGRAVAPPRARKLLSRELGIEDQPTLPDRGSAEESCPEGHDGGYVSRSASDQAANIGRNLNTFAKVENDRERPCVYSGDSESVQENSDIEHKVPHVPLVPAIFVGSVNIIDVIELSDVSVRLRNCITRANESGDLPVQTIDEYLAGLPDTEQRFLGIQSFGQNCAKELTNIIKKWEQTASETSGAIDFWKRIGLSETNIEAQLRILRINSSSHADGSSSSDSSDRNSNIDGREQRKLLCRIFEKVKFPECILFGPVSARLSHALDDFEGINGLECSSLGSFLEKKDQWMACLAQQKNVGRKSQEELLTILERIVSGLLTKTGLAPLEVTQLSAWLTRPEENSTSVLLTDEQWESLEEFREHCGQFVREVAVDGNINEATKNIEREPETGMCNFLQRQLDERDFDVLNRRCGINRSRRQTLEEVAEGYGITRERIRQIEAKAIKRCRLPAYHSVFQTFMETQRDEILSAVVGGASIVSLDDAAGWHNVVTGLQRLGRVDGFATS